MWDLGGYGDVRFSAQTWMGMTLGHRPGVSLKEQQASSCKVLDTRPEGDRLSLGAEGMMACRLKVSAQSTGVAHSAHLSPPHL